MIMGPDLAVFLLHIWCVSCAYSPEGLVTDISASVSHVFGNLVGMAGRLGSAEMLG